MTKKIAPREAQDIESQRYFTTKKGRRVMVSLWAACRAIDGAHLSADDTGLIREAIAEIAAQIGGAS